MNQIFLSTLLILCLNLVSAVDEDVELEAAEPIYPCPGFLSSPKNRWSCWSEGKSWKVCRLCDDLNGSCKIKSLDKCKCRNIEIDQKGKSLPETLLKLNFHLFRLNKKNSQFFLFTIYYN